MSGFSLASALRAHLLIDWWAKMKARASRLFRCRILGCRFGGWLPIEVHNHAEARTVSTAIRQCLRCRVIERGPEVMEREERRLG